MARNDKIHSRHLTLEGEFRTLLSRELQKTAYGSHSRYLMRKIPHYSDGKFWRDEDTAHIEKLEKEIRAYCEKFAQSSYLIRLVDDYTSRVAPMDSSQRKNLAREFLPRI